MIKVTVLGCGASSGVPIIACTCAVCKSDNPRNKRTRVSLFVETPGGNILIDTSPDMRAQCLRQNITRIDAVIYTHAHADHMHGIDDLRPFNYTKNAPIDAYCDADTLKSIQDRFGYVFMPPKPAETGWFRPCLNPIVITPGTAFSIGATSVLPFEQIHGRTTSLGLRIGNFAYSTDTNDLTEASFEALEGIDTWVVDCLRYKPAPTHAHLELTLEWIARVKPKRAYLTHLNHEFDYDALVHELPAGVFPAYDGLELVTE